ncbi:hypothetical protein NE236_20310 [Actinoallomurus purpureus]|uniref:hypothetical protein n=1 Tax=Actinoallomurus purpureus TaxID=478114 RepID=UPI00209213FD|nr:hypothetical protein [Actinoallomurus purpureus]MCO6007328.1 hypothetical protein [Actinoallomurus purpureus]
MDRRPVTYGGQATVVGDALVHVSGLRPDDPVDIMWTRMTRDGTAVKDDPWRVTYRAAPDGSLTVSFSGQVGIAADVRFRLRVYSPNPVPPTVSEATTARITLLSY